MLTKEQRNFYKKEIERLKKEQKSNKFDFSENDARELLLIEGYTVKKDGDSGIDNSCMLNVLKDRFSKMRADERMNFCEKLNSLFFNSNH